MTTPGIAIFIRSFLYHLRQPWRFLSFLSLFLCDVPETRCRGLVVRSIAMLSPMRPMRYPSELKPISSDVFRMKFPLLKSNNVLMVMTSVFSV